MRTSGAAHPSVSELLAWVGGSAEEGVGRHVAACEPCRRAAADWQAVSERCRGALRAEADQVFTGDRLAQQRDAIMQRVRQGPRGRVLRFPAPPSAIPGGPSLFGGRTRRWIAAAAVVGLLVGTLAGRFLIDPVRRTGAARVPVGAATPGAGGRAFPSPADEAFLVELDAAVFSSSPRALRAIDALTPDFER